MRLIALGRWGYRVSDTDAGKLANAVGRRLPKWGYELSVVLPHGEKARLSREALVGPGSQDIRFTVGNPPPKRDWVWYVQLDDADSEVTHRYRKPPALKRTALAKAKQAAIYARQLEEKLRHGREGYFIARMTYRGQAWSTRLRRAAAAAYEVAADAYEDAGDLLLAMRHRTNAEKLMCRRSYWSGELARRDPRRTCGCRECLL